MSHEATNPSGAGAAAHGSHAENGRGFYALVLGSIGVVYGDIGTSPLYAFREAVTAAKHGGLTGAEPVLGVLSLILWSLVLVVTIKYVLVLLNADNKGEGGTFALMALGRTVAKRSAPLLMLFGILGASFFYGDAILTPAISVLSAVEGLKLVQPALESVVVPVAIVILIGLFAVQSRGTARVAGLFGPITLVWFSLLAIGGLLHVLDDLTVLWAVSPYYAAKLVATNGVTGLVVLGLVCLAVTGAEALYADLGHFGRRPIQHAWLTIVLPALVLNYFGQGALVLAHPEAIDNPFYRLYPAWALLPMVIIATLATVIASQATITGAFSLTRQAIQLGLLPRFAINHTSESMAGQIYIPRVNMLLLVGVLLVVLNFRSSSNLAAAYGVSVTATMVLDSVMAIVVVWRCWNWPLWKTALLMAPLLLIEEAFLIANLLKVLDGGWFPLVVAAVMATVMLTWVRGSKLLAKQTRKNEADIDWLVRKLEAKPPHKVPGTAVFLTGDPTAAPTALMHNLKHNRVLHERNIILTIRTADVPRLPNSERLRIEPIAGSFTRVVATFGFMESPSIPRLLALARKRDLSIDMPATSFFLSRRALRPTVKTEMPVWQERLFIVLARSAEDATTYFQIPTDRVVEVGTQVGI